MRKVTTRLIQAPARKLALTAILITAAIFLFPAAAYAAGDMSDTSASDGRTMFQQFIWPGGGAIGLILITMNVATWALIIEQMATIRRSKLCPEIMKQQIAALFEQRNFRDAIELSASEPSMLSGVIFAALGEASGGFTAMQRALGEAVEQRANSLLRRIEALNIIGNIAPMLGLMGTVLGMILAFNRIVEDGGTPDAGRLADAIGLALVTTFWGLIVAVPAMAAWSVLRNRIDSLASETTATADELISTFRPEGKRDQ